MTGQELKIIRKSFGFTQIQFADRVGLKQSTISETEKMAQIPPMLEILVKILFIEKAQGGTDLASSRKEHLKKEWMEVKMRADSLLVDAKKILLSGTPFAHALEDNIESFNVAVDLWKEKHSHRPRQKKEEGKI